MVPVRRELLLLVCELPEGSAEMVEPCPDVAEFLEQEESLLPRQSLGARGEHGDAPAEILQLVTPVHTEHGSRTHVRLASASAVILRCYTPLLYIWSSAADRSPAGGMNAAAEFS